jgi:hypothetical protein
MKDSERTAFPITLSRHHEISHRKARDQLRRIPLDQLAPWIERYIDWRGFVLWTRAIVESEGAIPASVNIALAERCPGFDPREGVDREPDFWLRLCGWVDHNAFRQAEQEGWLMGLEYYACRDVRSEQLWLYWEHCDAEWQKKRPVSYPTFDQWRSEAHEWRFPERKHAPWDHAGRVTAARLKEAIVDYEYWESFAYWVRSVLTGRRGMPQMVVDRLTEHCPGFLETLARDHIDPANGPDVWLRLLTWIEDHQFAAAKAEGWFDAITLFARSGLRADRTVSYWAACDQIWSRRRPAEYPDFEDWRRAARAHAEP